MLGIILCGGQSLRMGRDKGLLKLEAKTWAQTAIDKMLDKKIINFFHLSLSNIKRNKEQ
jgi:molybdopterin-guanine dinucleotide biosynthesis protein A